MCLLLCEATNKQLLAVATHLWYDPKMPHVKVAQAHLLCKAVVEYQSELQQLGLLLAQPGSSMNGSNDGSHGGWYGSNAGGAADELLASEQTETAPMQQQQCLPVVICGDFNSLWKKYLADGFDRGVSVAGVSSASACTFC
jgi:endonuclease/exonuclease/phosphatase family metal-dependent hydrolase